MGTYLNNRVNTVLLYCVNVTSLRQNNWKGRVEVRNRSIVSFSSGITHTSLFITWKHVRSRWQNLVYWLNWTCTIYTHHQPSTLSPYRKLYNMIINKIIHLTVNKKICIFFSLLLQKLFWYILIGSLSQRSPQK